MPTEKIRDNPDAPGPRYNPTGRAEDDEVRELSFDEDNRTPPRSGDPRSPGENAQEFPDDRVRTAGLTGGESVDGAITDDDLAPETLFDEEETYGVSRTEQKPLDKTLRSATAGEIGGGFGKDEAELAREEHPDL